jgi:hypothetical protein
MKLGRRREKASPGRTQNPYSELRRKILDLGADAVDAPLRAAALEIGMAGGVATIGCVADGTTSMYTSTGGGYIGMGRHESVRRANAAFRASVADHLDRLAPAADVPLPVQGDVNVVAVTSHGLRLLGCSESDARKPAHAAYPMYVAAQEVVTAMRLVAEAQAR